MMGGIVGLAITFLAITWLADHFPSIYKFLWLGFIVSLICLIADPASGAIVTLCYLSVIVFLSCLVLVPLLFSYIAGLAFICLLIIGLHRLVYGG